MQWLYNHSTRGKVLTISIVMQILMIVIGIFGVRNASQLNEYAENLYRNEVLGISYIKEANLALVYMGRALSNIMLAQTDPRVDVAIYKAMMEQYESRAGEYIDKAAPLFQSADGQARIAEIRSAFQEIKQMDHNILTLANKESMAGLGGERASVHRFFTEAAPIADKIDLLMMLASEFKETNAKQTSENASDLYASNLNMSVLVNLLTAIIGFTLAHLIGNRMGQNTEKLADTLAQIEREQNFALRINIVDRDELGVAGERLNNLLQRLQQAISEANGVVSAVSNGDFSKRVTNPYTGDLELLKQSINASATNIAGVMSSLSSAMSNLDKGEFHIELTAGAPGEYGAMISNANNAMRSLNNVIAEINRVMQNMNDGSFNDRVKADAKGELSTLKANINNSMSNIAGAIEAISVVVASQAIGDLTQELPAKMFKGQLHDLKNAINFSSAKVKSSVMSAMDASNVVNEAAAQVSSGASDLSARVQEQAAALEQTSATMNEMASAVQANTANAHKVADLANQVQLQAGAGVDVMQKTIGAMQSIRESSSKIADIVTLIDGIAFQTNLLALNAAVEAARAGEHGRGFAVVAGEVRALAQKSAEAAKDIKDLINDSVNRVENGTQLAEKSGEMLNGITGSIQQVAGMIEEIANASNEQSIGIGQVHRAIADIDKVTQENSALVEATTSAAESLSHEAKQLKDNMSFFKTGVSSSAHYVHKSSAHKHSTSQQTNSTVLAKGLPAPNQQATEWQNF
jgi:methyl-accepting chemotaxis protein